MLRWLYLFMLSFSITQVAMAQVEHFGFTQFNEKNGLCDNIIYTMVKDKHGILWIGTQNGLSRFDGKHFYNFKRNKTNNSIINNTIYSLCLDKNGNIWGGTNNGMFKFNPNTNTFSNYLPPKNTHRNLVYNILCDKQGDIYATQNVSILKFKPQKNAFEHFIQLTSSKDSIDNFSIGRNCILLDDAHQCLWIGLKTGLKQFLLSEKKLIGYPNHINPIFKQRNISGLYLVQNSLWFSDNTAKEIIALNTELLTEIKRIPVAKQIPKLLTSKLLVDSKDRIWISSLSYELFVIDQQDSNRISVLKSIEGNTRAVSADFFWSAMEDENESIWLGTMNGITICNTSQPVYKALFIKKTIPELDSIKIQNVFEDPNDKSWWINVQANYIIHYFPKRRQYMKIYFSDFQPNHQRALPGWINQIHFKHNTMYFVTNAGIWFKTPNDSKIKYYLTPPNQLTDFTITKALFADTCDYFSNGRKLCIWNKNQQVMTWVDAISDQHKMQDIFAFKHLLWQQGYALHWTNNINYLGTLSASSQWQSIPILQNDSLENGAYIADAEMDKQGLIWLSNKGVGLYCYNSLGKKTRHWTELDGLADKDLHRIKLDLKGNVWGVYWNKISVFNPKENSFINFKIPYYENNLNYNNYFMLRSDGVMMTGIGNELFELSLDHLYRKPKTIMPSFSEVSFTGHTYFDTDNRTIHLKHTQNSLRIKYGLLLDPAAYPHTFEYILEGCDKTWTQVDYASEINYNNLPPGTYTFRLRAVKKNSKWQSAEKQLHFTIHTPFYKEWWFIISVIFALTLGLFLFYRYRLNEKEKILQLETKAEQLEKEKAQVMYDGLKQQLNPHFLFNSLTSLSGLIQLDQQQAGVFLEQMSGIYRYILKNNEHESVPLKQELEFAKLYVNLQRTRFRKGLVVEFRIEDAYLDHGIAPVTLQNLIENALKHNIIDEDSPLHIEVYIDKNYLVVRNNLQRKNKVETSNKKGIHQLKSLYKFLTEYPIEIHEDEQYFTIKIPLL